MSLMDPLADALTNIRNNELQVKDSCVISPASKLIGEVLSTMQKENYIGNFEYIDDNRVSKSRRRRWKCQRMLSTRRRSQSKRVQERCRP